MIANQLLQTMDFLQGITFVAELRGVVMAVVMAVGMRGVVAMLRRLSSCGLKVGNPSGSPWLHLSLLLRVY